MFYTFLKFPLGKIFLAKNDKGLCFARFMKNQGEFKEIAEFFKINSIPLELNEKKFQLEERLFYQYFKGKKEDFTSLPLHFFTGTSYQRKVWIETRKIPFGKTESYKSLAGKLKNRGYRSIGQALSRNPLLIVIPCHRVICSDGSLGGFSAGLELKEFLIHLERGPLSA